MKKLLMSLLLAGGGFVGLNGAQQMTPEELVFSEQFSRLKILSARLNSLLVGKTKECVEKALEKIAKNSSFQEFSQDISGEILEIAVEEYKKKTVKRKSPLGQYKKANPGLGLLLEQGLVSYSLSIQNLIDAGVETNHEDEFLNFSDLSITSLDGLQNILGLSEFLMLDLSDNKITKISAEAFAGLPALEYLYLSGNQITKIKPGTFSGLPALKNLHLSGNQIRKIKSGTFAGLINLKDLSLRSNQITETNLEVFSELPELNILNLIDNQIRKIDPEVLTRLLPRLTCLFQ